MTENQITLCILSLVVLVILINLVIVLILNNNLRADTAHMARELTKILREDYNTKIETLIEEIKKLKKQINKLKKG